MKLRTKLLSSFVLFALIASIVSYLGLRLAFQKITEDAIPTLVVTAQISTLAKILQAEALEFVAVGEEESSEQFSQHVGELHTLAQQLKNNLADDSDEAETFEELANLTEQMSLLGQEVIQSHRQTLAQLDVVNEVEGKVEGSGMVKTRM